MDIDDRWHLGTVSIDIDNWKLKLSNYNYSSRTNYIVEVYEKGKELDFTLTSPYSIPIVHDKIKVKLEFIDHISFRPIGFPSYYIESQYWMLQTEDPVECMNRALSTYEIFPSDFVNPNVRGHFKNVDKAVLDRDIVKDLQVFRVKYWDNNLIVRHDIKQMLEEFSGIKFTCIE